MTFQISVKEMQNLLLRFAEYVGPAAYQYIKILKDSDYPINYDWYILTVLFAKTDDSDVLEESCYIAMKKGIIDMGKFEKIIKEVALANSY